MLTKMKRLHDHSQLYIFSILSLAIAQL
jgi:hypothetical protein